MKYLMAKLILVYKLLVYYNVLYITCVAISDFGPNSKRRRANEAAVLKFLICEYLSLKDNYT